MQVVTLCSQLHLDALSPERDRVRAGSMVQKATILKQFFFCLFVLREDDLP